MTVNVEVGTVLMENRPVMAKALGLQSAPYSANWGVLTALDGSGINRTVQDAGWNFFFMAAEVKVMFLGAVGAERIQNALQRILVRVKPLNFNCLELTGIAAKRFLGVPYTVVLGAFAPYPRELLPRWRQRTSEISARRHA